MSCGGTTTSPLQVASWSGTVAAHAAMSLATTIRNSGMDVEYRLASARARVHRFPETSLDVRRPRSEVARGDRERGGRAELSARAGDRAPGRHGGGGLHNRFGEGEVGEGRGGHQNEVGDARPGHGLREEGA